MHLILNWWSWVRTECCVFGVVSPSIYTNFGKNYPLKQINYCEYFACTCKYIRVGSWWKNVWLSTLANETRGGFYRVKCHLCHWCSGPFQLAKGGLVNDVCSVGISLMNPWVGSALWLILMRDKFLDFIS